MRYPLLTAVTLCLCCQAIPGLAAGNGYHAGSVLLADASGDQFQVQDDTPPTVPEDNLPPVQPVDQGDMTDQSNNADQTDQSGQPDQNSAQDQSQDQDQTRQDDQGNQDSGNDSSQSQPASQESDQNQEDERAIRRMCQEYSAGLPDDEKAQYLQDCIRSQSY